MQETRPDIVFHVAAQRDPGLAEKQELDTIATNIFGTRNVIEACTEAGVARLVFASTGKALRFYTRDVYAATKRICEFLVADAASRRFVRASAVRFTHVVDNSIVLHNFREACRRQDLVRVHCADAVFYVQSALEASQLLLAAAVSPSTDALDLLAIRNLEWPIGLLDLAIGTLAAHGPAPLYIAGYDAGYAEQQYPALYDPAVSGGVSPLLNALEGAEAMASPSPDVDLVRRHVRLPPSMWQRLMELETACAGDASQRELRALLDGTSAELLEIALEIGAPDSLSRVCKISERFRPEMNETNRWLDDRIRWWAAQRNELRVRARRPTAAGARA